MEYGGGGGRGEGEGAAVFFSVRWEYPSVEWCFQWSLFVGEG